MGRIPNQRFGQYANWDDLRFPAQGINPPGLVSDPDISVLDGMLLFDDASTEIIMGVAQMPHTWKEGSMVSPHIHWIPTDANAGDVLWRFQYELFCNGTPPTQTYTTVDTVVATDSGAYALLNVGEIDMTGFEVSCMIAWRLSRIGGDVLDTYGSDAKLYEFDIHYLKDSLGSEREYTKYTMGE